MRSHTNSHTKIGTSTRFSEAQSSSASGMTIWIDAHLSPAIATWNRAIAGN
ncbi:MAG: hypothetical protein HC903_03075 [Methylacidiphilales bacterium]|nr:hypothetical protein [Candidatus Methylacidiphilales bacterium]NJR14525.1 hypothetical protein [Calothrix sp. CSU_2_0]